MNSAAQILSTADDSAASPGAHTMSEQFCRANEESALSEERLRDLFDEAPIAYVLQGLDSRIIQANRTAIRMLRRQAREDPGIVRSVSGPRYPRRSTSSA